MEKFNLFSSIKSKMILSFVFLIVTTLLIMGGLVGYRVYEQTKMDYMTSVEQQIKLMDIGIGHYISNIANNTKMLANLPLMKSATDGITSYVDLTGPEGKIPMEPLKGTAYEREVFGILDSFQKSHVSVQNASLATAQNGGFVKSPPSARFDHYDAREREWYQSALAHQGSVYLSEMYVTSSNENVIYSVMAIEDGQGKIRGVISLDINLKDLSEMVDEIKFGESGYVVLADSKGNILAHPKDKTLVGQPLEALGIEGLNTHATDREKIFVETLQDQNAYWIRLSSSEVPYFPLQYIVIIEEKAFFATATRLLKDLIIITLVLLGLSIVIAYVLSLKISIPILKLTHITEAFSRGDLDNRAQIESHDEIGNLAMQFNEMADRICIAKNTMEQKVKERTSELFEANAHLKTMNTELVETLEMLKSMQNQLVHSEKLAGLGTLVAGVAHEINTPVGIAITAISHLSDARKAFDVKYQSGGVKRKELEDYILLTKETTDITMRNLDRAKTLIHNFKQVSADQTSEVRRTINLGEYLESVVESVKPQLKQTEHVILIECPENIEILTYPGSIAQIVTNLILNSIKHGYLDNNYGLLKIVVTNEEEQITMTYSDDGMGISPEIIPKIFDPFFTTKRDSGGTGLGLHIVYNIVNLQLNGTIHCTSVLNQGTNFIIQFPLKINEESKNE